MSVRSPSPPWLPKTAITIVRLAPVIAVLMLYPLVRDVLLDRPGAVATLHADSADLLGTASLLTLAGAFAVTPLRTLTGWRWHLILARDLGLWTAFLALGDLVIAATTAEDGWLAGTTGSAVPAAGTMAALLLVPLALTSNRMSMRLLGRDWKRLHRLVYPVIALVALHLFLLEGVRGPAEVALLFGPLILLRLGPVRRRVARRRKRSTRSVSIVEES
jgi:sulfoxide reductase heme-binding subunit YedZ